LFHDEYGHQHIAVTSWKFTLLWLAKMLFGFF